jgi:hypothetical protein
MKYEDCLLIPLPLLITFYGIIYLFGIRWIFPTEGIFSFLSVPLHVATIMYTVFWIFILGLIVKMIRNFLRRNNK